MKKTSFNLLFSILIFSVFFSYKTVFASVIFQTPDKNTLSDANTGTAGYNQLYQYMFIVPPSLDGKTIHAIVRYSPEDATACGSVPY